MFGGKKTQEQQQLSDWVLRCACVVGLYGVEWIYHDLDLNRLSMN